MPKSRKGEIVQCQFFTWILKVRHGVYYADGRSNQPSGGRHSLGTRDAKEAKKLVSQLDRKAAEMNGMAPRTMNEPEGQKVISLVEGRRKYEIHSARPRAIGGMKPASRKRNRTVFDKFVKWAEKNGVAAWNAVTAEVLTRYATFLERKGYSHQTLRIELTTLKGVSKWLLASGQMTGVAPIVLPLRRAEGESPYCYSDDEVSAMIAHCESSPELHWIRNVIIALACTGLRIAELAGLRWSDIDLKAGTIYLSDESGHAKTTGKKRELKSGRSRILALHGDLEFVLKRLPKLGRLVFLGPRGGLLKPDTVRNIFVREVIEPLKSKFPSEPDEKGFKDGRLHSFRHYFCSTCANQNVAERIVMEWLGHADSEMVSRYYHLNDAESKQKMNSLTFFSRAQGTSDGAVSMSEEAAEQKSRDQSA